MASTAHAPALRILDMADEILLQICIFVKGVDLSTYDNMDLVEFYDMGQDDVMSLRLTCRRFCNVSSELLLPLLTFRFYDESFLAKLVHVSHRALLTRGVRSIKVKCNTITQD